jgi:GNAT superfamily N-acetyltransferase
MWNPRPDLRLRPAVPDDGEIVAAMCRQLSVDEGSSEVAGFTADAFRRDGFGAIVRFRCIVAELAGSPIGYALLCPDYDTDRLCRSLFMVDLYVEKTARRRGIAHALMAAAADAGRLAGARWMMWTALRDNAAARAFYLRVGREDDRLIECHASGSQFQATAAGGPPSAAYRLRPAQAADCTAIAGFLAALCRDTGRVPIDDAEARLRRDGFGADPAFSAAIAEAPDGAPIGYALYWPLYDTDLAAPGGLLSDIYVAPAWRRHGVARGLMTAVAGDVARFGGAFLGWFVDADNEGARAFYRRLATEAPEVAVFSCDEDAFERLAETGRAWRP